MYKLFSTALLGATLAMAAVPAAAASIVDTGQTSSDAAGWTVASFQHLAAEFTTDADFVVTEVLGYQFATEASTIRLSLYSDGGDLPGSLLHSATYSIADAMDDAWLGASDLSWALTAGTYWIAFEGVSGTVGMRPGAPSPLGNEAFWSAGGGWSNADFLDLGVRINGEPGIPGAIPEPATWAMLIAGFGLVGASLRRRRPATA